MTESDASMERVRALVDAALASIIEHADSVRIFVTVHDGANDRTKSFSRGRGNFYAQFGSVQEWMIATDQQARNEESKETDQ